MATPDLTVAVVTYGAIDWVQRSIAAIRAHTDVPYQLVVVDNASTDGTTEWLADNVDPTELVALPANAGFAAANDLAVNLACAPVLAFVNSDALVPPGWAPPLMTVLRDPSVVAVAPLLVNADGTVQEAGCNVDAHGDITPLGLGDDPSTAEYTWPRRVQHASAACLLARTADVRAAGAFDCGYGLAYYEDVDLLTTLQRSLRHVVLVPTVRVMHARSASTPDRAQADARVAANRPRFVARQSSALAHRHHAYDLPNEPHRYVAARDASAPERRLVLVDELPALDAPGFAAGFDGPLLVFGVLGALDATGAAAWRACGAEVLALPDTRDVTALVEQRRFHFSTVEAARGVLDQLGPALDHVQPQAVRIERPRRGSAAA